MTAANLKHVTIVLNAPRFPENIGSAARALWNMGFADLAVVNPECYDLTRVQRLATHAAAPVVAAIQQFDTLERALAPFTYVVGTTARRGGERQRVFAPDTMARKLMPLTAKNHIALVFGPEDRGLTNAELRRCHDLVTIPTAEFSSLNLAQAVMVMVYELHRASLKPRTNFAPRLATRHELDGMYAQLSMLLTKIDYINPENPDYWMNKIRHFGTRMQLRAKEVSILRGICRQMNWYAGKCYRDGLAAGRPKPGNLQTKES
ncbi:MAG: RNA methyltransferase [Desulfobacterales bacterium]